MKKKTTVFVAVFVTAVFSLALAVSGFVRADPAQYDTRIVNYNDTALDFDGTDGYSGDYVLAYNTSTSRSVQVSFDERQLKNDGVSSVDTEKAIKYKRDYHAPSEFSMDDIRNMQSEEKGMYSVGSTKRFSIQNITTGVMQEITFACLAVGEHCYVWSPTSGDYRIESIDSSYPQTIATEFDSKFPLMVDSFGSFWDPIGENKLHLVFYDIQCGWTPGHSYVAGYYTIGDYYYNDLAMVNIDTYPGITTNGSTGVLSDAYATLVHEFQHLINDNVSSYADLWLNEMKSAAAEEICYPGSSVAYRIKSWTGGNYISLYDDDGEVSGVYSRQDYPAYAPEHKGASLYSWSTDDSTILCTYAQATLLAQYLYTQTGTNAIFKEMSRLIGSGIATTTAFSRAMAGTPLDGMSTADIIRDFKIALVLNDPELYNGRYSFKLQPGYDPTPYSGTDDLYELLAPVVFSGSSVMLSPNGSVVIKPANGIFYPETTSSTLIYVGITTSERYGAGGEDTAGFTDGKEPLALAIEEGELFAGRDYTLNVEFPNGTVSAVRYGVLSGKGSVVLGEENVAYVRASEAGSIKIYAEVDVGNETYCGVIEKEFVAVAVASFDDNEYPCVTEVVHGHEYLVVTENEGKYYALSSISGESKPYSLVSYEVLVTEKDGKLYVGGAACSLNNALFAALSSGENTYKLVNAGKELTANVFGMVEMAKPFMPSDWTLAFDGQSCNVRQSKFAKWSFLSLNSDSTGFACSDSVKTDFILFDMGQSQTLPTITPTATPTQTALIPTPTPTATVEPTPPPTPTEPPTTEEPYILGDATNDGKVNTADAVSVLRYSSGYTSIVSFNLEAADMTQDGRVNTGDAVAILRKVAGLT